LIARQTGQRHHACEEYGDDKPRNKSSAYSHASTAPIRFPKSLTSPLSGAAARQKPNSASTNGQIARIRTTVDLCWLASDLPNANDPPPGKMKISDINRFANFSAAKLEFETEQAFSPSRKFRKKLWGDLT
jgi:hypothetical protein